LIWWRVERREGVREREREREREKEVEEEVDEMRRAAAIGKFSSSFFLLLLPYHLRAFSVQLWQTAPDVTGDVHARVL
jgi:hypothetical protein